MNPFKIFRNKPADHQLVVVLQGDQAYWFRWHGQRLEGTFTEQMTADSLSKQSHCPWIEVGENQAECKVQLVLDTCQDEVDRVKVEDLSDGWKRTIQRHRMASRLRRDYPLANIHQLPVYAAPDVLSIVHHIIPTSWEEWLTQLQSQDVCITHVATSLQLLSECSGKGIRLAGSHQESRGGRYGGPVLFSLLLDTERRHLLLDGGVPMFMRLVSEEGAADAFVAGAAGAADVIGPDVVETGLLETLQHVNEQITQNQLSVQVAVPLAPWPELESRLHAASVLAALSQGHPVEFDTLALNGVEGGSSELQPGETVLPKKTGMWLLALRRLLVWVCGRFHRQQAGQRRWQLTNEFRFVRHFLQASIIQNAQRLRIQKLQRATLICAWMATASVAIASVHGITSARQRAQLTDQKQHLAQKIDVLSESVRELNDRPEFVVRSVARIEDHASARPMDAVGVLATVASAINDYPAIVLDSLSWSVMPDNQPIDLAFTAMSQIPQREQLWHADSTVEKLQVEISGTVMDVEAQGLREQQRVLDSFVVHLQTLPSLVEVNVMESPVNAARSSERVDDEDSSYRLSLQLRTY
ncbi:hypothetical protein [Granulosicoccus antarcticus]|uniref:Uncharacterized protein n=1 Tax=Granulosicoccus antarcticus IMCC3135 TaxID=1192854 RepID=A0A2Z2NY73_9GAMM|nr:hypothetical protein [Granulosicoccus antarcticus]ASJ76239.1 hypothetical protein IMCC3135_30950 [Granulosicoccus antarcticus IMCC3135]